MAKSNQLTVLPFKGLISYSVALLDPCLLDSGRWIIDTKGTVCIELAES